jgi:hypothetical protein
MDRLLRAVLKPPPHGNAGTCPDAGLLAAFAEGGLAADEQSALDAHIVDCGRCQEALAVLSHELPREEEDVSAAPYSAWFTWVTRPRLRWLVPISAAATVAVVFFATRPLIAPEGEVPGAEVAQLAQAPPPAELPAAAVEASRESPAAGAGKSESTGAPRRDDAAKTQVGLAGAKPVEPAAEMLAARVATEERRTPPAVAAQAAVSPPAADVPAKATAATKMPAADQLRAAPGPVATPSVREELDRLEPTPIVTAATDRTVRWRLGPGGRIWRSTDAGSSWHWQLSGVSANLVAGSAPSATTCWAVGASGVVLLTVDGERWTLLPFPLSVDLVAVEATSARVGTVTTRDGRRFETLDAGLTWSPR